MPECRVAYKSLRGGQHVRGLGDNLPEKTVSSGGGVGMIKNEIEIEWVCWFLLNEFAKFSIQFYLHFKF